MTEELWSAGVVVDPPVLYGVLLDPGVRMLEDGPLGVMNGVLEAGVLNSERRCGMAGVAKEEDS